MCMYDMLRMHWPLCRRASLHSEVPSSRWADLFIYLLIFSGRVHIVILQCSRLEILHDVTTSGNLLCDGWCVKRKALICTYGVDGQWSGIWMDRWLTGGSTSWGVCTMSATFYILSAKPWKLPVKQQQTTVVRVLVSFVTACVHCLVTTPSCKISQVLADGCMLCDTFSFMFEHSFPL